MNYSTRHAVQVLAWPLIDTVRASGALVNVPNDSTEYREYFRARKRGHLTVRAADRLAVRLLGMHPCEIWSDWFELDQSAG